MTPTGSCQKRSIKNTLYINRSILPVTFGHVLSECFMALRWYLLGKWRYHNSSSSRFIYSKRWSGRHQRSPVGTRNQSWTACKTCQLFKLAIHFQDPCTPQSIRRQFDDKPWGDNDPRWEKYYEWNKVNIFTHCPVFVSFLLIMRLFMRVLLFHRTRFINIFASVVIAMVKANCRSRCMTVISCNRRRQRCRVYNVRKAPLVVGRKFSVLDGDFVDASLEFWLCPHLFVTRLKHKHEKSRSYSVIKNPTKMWRKGGDFLEKWYHTF